MKTAICRLLQSLNLQLCLFTVGLALNQPNSVFAAAAPATKLQLEQIKIRGSDRIRPRFIEQELALKKGATIDPQTLEDIQLVLFGLGLFQSITVKLEKGSARGEVNLIVELVDDPYVLGRGAVGGKLRLIYDENGLQTLTEDQPPLGFFGELIARNMFYQQHRARLSFDVDSKGVYRHLEASYGLPKFSKEAVQFDAHFSVFDTTFHYLDTIGFGGSGSAVWSYDTALGSVGYGIAMLTNRPPRFSFPGMPSSVIGPQFTFTKETRLLSFVPSPGYKLAPYVLVPPGDYSNTVVGFNSALTLNLYSNPLTFELDAQSVGTAAFGLRTTTLFEIPFDTGLDRGNFYLSFKTGYDDVESLKYWGQSFRVGMRYHSSGFIADLSLRLSTLPKLDRFKLDEAL